jgi:hypothetical protein
MTDALQENFERQFHSRTLAYLPGYRDDGRPVVVEFSPSAHCPAGHALAHALFNLLARAHASIVVVGDLDRPLLCRTLFGSGTLAQATIGLARSINPYIKITTATTAPRERLISLGIGPARADLDLGADGWVAVLGDGARVDDRLESRIGGSLAACLGSYAAFAKLTGTGQLPPGRWSAWDFLESDAQGPALAGALDIGRVLCAGAGAVASALAFFGVFIGLAGEWTIVDGDVIDVSNLNRQLAFLAFDTGWPYGAAHNKAAQLASRIGPTAQASPRWYGDEPGITSTPYDVVLALANERGVRADLAYRQPTVLLHATTSPNWQAQVHRHVAGQDDCLTCRLPDAAPKLKCSEGNVKTPAGATMDAALPFLSATAGLLLLVLLHRLAHGRLLETDSNYAAVEFGSHGVVSSRAMLACAPGCRTRLNEVARQHIDSNSRWKQLDQAA